MNKIHVKYRLQDGTGGKDFHLSFRSEQQYNEFQRNIPNEITEGRDYLRRWKARLEFEDVVFEIQQIRQDMERELALRTPPWPARFLICTLIPSRDREEVLGDLEERWQERKLNPKLRGLWLFWQFTKLSPRLRSNWLDRLMRWAEIALQFARFFGN